VFYDKAGTARSVAGVYAELSRRYQVARSGTAPVAPAVAANAAAPGSFTPSRRAVPAVDTAAITTAFAAANADSQPAGPATTASGGPVFYSLFHSDERGGPIAPVVSEFWGVGAERAGAKEAKAALAPALPATAPTSPTPLSSPGRRLDLFRDTRPNVRALFDGKV
jgi:hypothetical protein